MVKDIPQLVQDKYFLRIQEIISHRLEIEKDHIGLDADLRNDLGADSLSVVNIIESTEKEFSVVIPDDVVDRIRTVGDVLRALSRASRWSSLFLLKSRLLPAFFIKKISKLIRLEISYIILYHHLLP